MTAATRVNIGSAISQAISSAVASLAYSSNIRVQNTEGAPLADVWLTGVTFGAAPVAGALMLALVARDSAGNVGPTPSASMVPEVYPFNPQPSTGNTSTGWIMACRNVPIPADCDLYIYNASTGQSLTAATVNVQRFGYGV